MIRLIVLVLALQLASGLAIAGPEKLYREGKFKEAEEGFSTAIEKRPESWELHYNRGAAAYKAGAYDKALEAFERATGSPAKPLQSRSLYNLGNTHYRVGEAAEKQSIEAALPLYEKALKSYESTLALAGEDDDARHNLDVVKRKIEELKKKQEEQKQEQQQQQKSDKDDQQKPSPDKQDQPQEQSKQQDDQQKQPPQDPQQAKSEEQQGKAEENQQQPAPEKPEPAEGSQETAATPEAAEARQLLDRLREQERVWNYYPEMQKESRGDTEPEKDW